ncbi:hypothetical protein ACFTZ8_31120 [Streptomyces fungicidicus]|uniref:hypothetical protein n=1 Tax=Streptomyces fungicidicus TaxID=68203 RepID=UPI0033E53559
MHDRYGLPGEEDEGEVSARLGVGLVRLLCAYLQKDGRVALELAGKYPLAQVAASGKMPVTSVREVMLRTSWLKETVPNSIVSPKSWADIRRSQTCVSFTVLCRAGACSRYGAAARPLRVEVDCGLVRR